VPMTCRVCLHTDHQAIDTAIVAGTPYRTIAAQYGLSASAIFRHKSVGHVASNLVEAKQNEKAQSADFIMAELVKLRKTAQKIVNESMKEKPAVAVGALRELRGLLTLHAELEGRLLKRREVSVTGTLTLAADQAVAYARTLEVYTADFLRRYLPELIPKWLEGVPDKNSVRRPREGGAYGFDSEGQRLLSARPAVDSDELPGGGSDVSMGGDDG
jgi:hypothetical protein